VNKRALPLLALFVCAAANAAIDPDVAHRAFAALQANCTRDNGALWTVSLCGKVVIVDKASRVDGHVAVAKG
jgi:hypothetical protein